MLTKLYILLSVVVVVSAFSQDQLKWMYCSDCKDAVVAREIHEARECCAKIMNSAVEEIIKAKHIAEGDLGKCVTEVDRLHVEWDTKNVIKGEQADKCWQQHVIHGDLSKCGVAGAVGASAKGVAPQEECTGVGCPDDH